MSTLEQIEQIRARALEDIRKILGPVSVVPPVGEKGK